MLTIWQAISDPIGYYDVWLPKDAKAKLLCRDMLLKVVNRFAEIFNSDFRLVPFEGTANPYTWISVRQGWYHTVYLDEQEEGDTLSNGSYSQAQLVDGRPAMDRAMHHAIDFTNDANSHVDTFYHLAFGSASFSPFLPFFLRHLAQLNYFTVSDHKRHPVYDSFWLCAFSWAASVEGQTWYECYRNEADYPPDADDIKHTDFLQSYLNAQANELMRSYP